MQRQFSAGGVVYKKEHGDTLFLIRKSTPSNSFYTKNPWSLPKGWLDDAGDSPGPLGSGRQRATQEQMQAAALREVAEETGIKAKIISRLGSDQFFFVNHTGERVLKTVSYYLMEYESELPEGFGYETSEISWQNADATCKLLALRKGECNQVRKAETILNES